MGRRRRGHADRHALHHARPVARLAGSRPPRRLPVQGITLCEWRRDWDAAIWPHATAGFFKVKQNIPRILEQALPA